MKKVSNKIPDTRPLDQRMNKEKRSEEIRKGMIKTRETVNIAWLEKEQTLFPL